jgi:hypothetical protein
MADLSEWGGAGFVKGVALLKEPKKTAASIQDRTEWGDLDEYLPSEKKMKTYSASRLVDVNNEGKDVVKLHLGPQWRPAISTPMSQLEFVKKSGSTDRLVSTKPLNFMDSLDWKPVDKVEIIRTPATPPANKVKFTGKIAFQDRKDPNHKVWAYWCWE